MRILSKRQRKGLRQARKCVLPQSDHGPGEARYSDIKRTVHRAPRGFAGEVEIHFEVPYMGQPRLGVVVFHRPPQGPRVLVSTSTAHGFGTAEDIERLRYALGLAADEVRVITKALDEGRDYDPAALGVQEAA